MGNGIKICIFKKITSLIYDIAGIWCSWFFYFFIFYANLKFPVSFVQKKSAEKVAKNDSLMKKIPMMCKTNKYISFFFWADLTTWVWNKEPSFR